VPQYLYDQTNGELYVGDIAELRGELYHHIVNVRRHKTGDTILLRLGNGNLVHTSLHSASDGCCSLLVKSIEECHSFENSLSVAMPLLKGKCNDLIIEKCVEIGVNRIIPVVYKRSIPDYDSCAKKEPRWLRIIEETFKQCMAHDMPVLEHAITSEDLFVQHSCTALIAHVHSSTELNSDLLIGDTLIAVGPEGGFDDSELSAACKNDWQTFKLSLNQLKAETASIVIPAILRERLK
jgi:16S rRNA (uracil1498-N3)-methyltransferase